MLNEIIESIGYDNILKNVKESINMSNSLYIRINRNNPLEEKDFLLVKKEVPISQLELSKWFQEREFLSKYIESNKAVVIGSKNKYPKTIFSIHKNAIIFNWNKFINHKNTSENIEQSLNCLFKEYLTKLGSNDYLEYYCKNIKTIVSFIQEKQLKKIIIKIFLDTDIEEYKQEYNEYLKNNLFDNKTKQQINNICYGRLSQFYNINNKKPLLSYMIKNTDEIHLINENESLKIYYLKKYMDEVKKGNIKNNACIGNINFKMDFNSSTKKYKLQNYKNNPYNIENNLSKYIYITNVLENKKSDERIIKTYEDLIKYILQLTDFKVKKFYGDNDRTESKFKTYATMYKNYIFNLNNTTINNFKDVFDNLMKNMFNLYKYEEDMYKITNILTFNICLKDYLFKTNLKGEIKNMIDKIKEKILNMDKVYNIEDKDEFYILCGQLAKYLKGKTSTDKITNKLFTRYIIANRCDQLINILQEDKDRLDYDDMNTNRAGEILSGLNIYYKNHIKDLRKIDKISFNIGLYYGDCLLYVSNKE